MAEEPDYESLPPNAGLAVSDPFLVVLTAS